MRSKRMGRSGLRVSEICLGTMTFGSVQCDEPTSHAIMDAAAELGVDFIDTADKYPVPGEIADSGRTEEIVGRWLRGKRDRFVLVSKCGNQVGQRPHDRGLSRKHVIEACEASLRRLQTDRLDLYLLHVFDPATPIEETLAALDDLVRSGKVLYVGCSNFAAWQTAQALGVSAIRGLAPFVAMQPRYNALYREAERELFPLAASAGLGVMTYNPLAGGVLSGKYRGRRELPADTRFTLGPSAETYRKRYWQDAELEAVENVAPLADARGVTLAQAAVTWVLAQERVTSVILGATRPEQLREAIAATELTLDGGLRAALDALWYRLPRRRPEEEP